MKTANPKKQSKRYTLTEANAMLPLLRSILRDVTALAHDLKDRYERLTRLQKTKGQDPAHQGEIKQLAAEFETGQEKMHEYESELQKLNVELKDYYTGLVDFRHMRDGREVYLCWKLGEDEIRHWHELNTGFQSRRSIDETILNG